MESKIARAIGMKYSPVAVVFADQRPQEAIQFKEGRWGCVVSMLAAAAKGRTAVFDRRTFGCLGGGTGLGLGNYYVNFPGGIEYFLSTGNKEFCQTEVGRNVVRNMPALEDGERYIKTPELARKFIEMLPVVNIKENYVIFKPLEKLAGGEVPKVVVFLVNPDQLSALVVLANYARESNDNVCVPMGAGCHTIGIFPYREDEAELPRAVIGLTDISARKHVDRDVLSFAVPYRMFLEMESNVEGSFLEKEEWLHVLKRNP